LQVADPRLGFRSVVAVRAKIDRPLHFERVGWMILAKAERVF